jgi:hypothetical protein
LWSSPRPALHHGGAGQLLADQWQRDELTRAFYINKLGKTIKEVTLYLASNDPPTVPRLTRFSSRPARELWRDAVATSTQNVILKGQAGQNLPTNFIFPSSAIPSGTKNVAFQFKVLSNPHGARVFFARGATSCSSITETAGVLPLPLSTPLGKGVGVKVLGN